MNSMITLSVAEHIANYFKGSPEEIVTVLLAMMPIAELRGAIPWALTLGQMNWTTAIPLAILGNMIPIPFILLLLGKAEKFLSRWKIWQRFFAWLFARTRKRSGLIEKYGPVALIVFVGIPLPITGAWTGSVAAFLLDIPVTRALLYIFIGVCLASVVVTLATVGGIGIFKIFVSH